MSTARLLLASLSLISPVWRLWRHEQSKLDTQPRSWFWGRFAWRAARRAAPLLLSVYLPLIMIVIAINVVDSVQVAEVGTDVVFALALIALVLLPCVALWNRPKWVVPPHLRDEPGLFRDLMQHQGERRVDQGQ